MEDNGYKKFLYAILHKGGRALAFGWIEEIPHRGAESLEVDGLGDVAIETCLHAIFEHVGHDISGECDDGYAWE